MGGGPNKTQRSLVNVVFNAQHCFLVEKPGSYQELPAEARPELGPGRRVGGLES